MADCGGSGSVGVVGRGGGLHLVSSSWSGPGVPAGRLFGVAAGLAQALPVGLVGGAAVLVGLDVGDVPHWGVAPRRAAEAVAEPDQPGDSVGEP